MKNIAKIIAINSLVMGAILGIAEASSRLLHPRLTNNTYSQSKTRGINTFHDFKSGVRVRTPSPKSFASDEESTSKTVLIAGDSVSEGYGVMYSEIYSTRLQKKF